MNRLNSAPSRRMAAVCVLSVGCVLGLLSCSKEPERHDAAHIPLAPKPELGNKEITPAAVPVVTKPASGNEAKEPSPVASSKTAEVVVGKNVGNDAGLLHRGAADKSWQPVMKNENLHAGDLLVGLYRGAIESSNGAVRLALYDDFDREAPLPILEPAVRLRGSKGFDLDFSLERGLVHLINQKKEGTARVRVWIQDHPVEVTLEKPGTCLGLIVFGRWAKGARFATKPGPKDVPIIDVIALAIQGDSLLKGPLNEYRLEPPPGPALISRSNREDEELEPPQELQKLPEWAFPEKIDTERGKKVEAQVDQFRQLVLRRSLDAAIEEYLKSDDPVRRGIALVILGATDDLPRLGQVLRRAKDPETWDFAVMILRHWMGRGPGQDQKLYQGMLAGQKVKPSQVATILQLLHSFSDADLALPETYETLIAYLDHDELAVRGLAHWHLYRLVPAGRKIGYNPLAPKEEREKAIKEWQKLIPAGKLPPASTPEKSPGC